MQESGRPTLAVGANRSLWLGGRSAGVQPPKMEKTTGPCHRLVEEKKGWGKKQARGLTGAVDSFHLASETGR